MWVLGLIDEYDCCKNYVYNSYEEAKKELDFLKKMFKNNNVVQRSTTIVVRDICDRVEQVKIVFELKGYDKYIMFLSKARE